MDEAYIVAAARTAGGRRGGRLAGVHPVDLGAAIIDPARSRRCGSRPRGGRAVRMRSPPFECRCQRPSHFCLRKTDLVSLNSTRTDLAQYHGTTGRSYGYKDQIDGGG